MTLLVGELEETARLDLLERRVGRGGGDVARGRLLGEVVVGELLDRAFEIARADGRVTQRLRGDRGPLGEIALPLAGLERDVALPAQIGRVLETARVPEHDAQTRHGSIGVYG